MNPIDDLRGAYNQFIRSEAGKDFLKRIVAYETQLEIDNYRPDTTNEKKITNTDKRSALYWVRTQLQDLSKPKPTPAVRGGSTRRSAQ